VRAVVARSPGIAPVAPGFRKPLLPPNDEAWQMNP
jgi:hypothetical protein